VVEAFFETEPGVSRRAGHGNLGSAVRSEGK